MMINFRKTLAVTAIIIGTSVTAYCYQADTGWSCKLVTMEISLMEVEIKDSIIAKILDAALPRIQTKTIEGYTVPYKIYMNIEINVSDKNSNQVILSSTNNYEYYYSEYVDTVGNKRKSQEIKTNPIMLLNFKGYQIVVNTRNSTVFNYIKPTGNRADYTLYLFRTTTERGNISECSSEPGIDQTIEIDFYKKKYSIFKDCTIIFDRDYIYGDRSKW